MLATLGIGQFISTEEMTTTFVRPTTARSFVGRGRIIERRGEDIMVAAALSEADGGKVVATARAHVRVIRR